MDLATLSAFADLDGRTGDEAIVLLAENSGGSGHLLHLAVVGLDVSGPMNLATTLVGDRAQVRSLGVAGSRIALDLVEHAPDDPRCCPTRLTTRAYGLKGRDLVLIAKDDRGPLSPAALGRQTWTLTRLDADRTMRGDPVISLVFEGDRVSGSGGCNRYFGDLIAGAPGQVTFGPIGSTRMACPKAIMDLETRYLAQLGAVTQYGFVQGDLALSWREGDRSGVMLFDTRRQDDLKE